MPRRMRRRSTHRFNLKRKSRGNLGTFARMLGSAFKYSRRLR